MTKFRPKFSTVHESNVCRRGILTERGGAYLFFRPESGLISREYNKGSG